MYGPKDIDRPMTPAERWGAGLFLLVLVGLFSAEIVHNYQPAKLACLLIVLFWIPLLALHEAGHALMASALGWRVIQVVIGMGKVLTFFRIGSAHVEIRLFPVEGFVRSAPTDLSWPQVKSALIYFAGPGIELLLAVILLVLMGPDRLFSRSDDYGVITCQSLAVACMVHVVLNLIPHAIQTPEGFVPNDGLGIIYSLMQPTSHYSQMVRPDFPDESQKRELWQHPEKDGKG